MAPTKTKRTQSVWTLALLAQLLCGMSLWSLMVPTVEAQNMNVPANLPVVSPTAATSTTGNLRAWRHLRQLEEGQTVTMTADSDKDNSKTKEWQAKKREQWMQQKQAKKNGGIGGTGGGLGTTSKDQKDEDKEEVKGGDNEEEAEADEQEDKDPTTDEADETPTTDKADEASSTKEAKPDEEGGTTSTSPSIPFPSVNVVKNVNVNVTAISLTACEQIEMAVAFLTSLDFDQDFMNLTQVASDLAWTATHSKNKQKQKRPRNAAIWDVYLLQLIILPISLAMAFCGSNLLLPSCCLAAAGSGVFLVFHFLQQLSASSNKYASFFQLDCQMKLALGVVSASLSAMLANFFVRFGLFCLGALTAGGGAYLVLDAFPWLMDLETFLNNHDSMDTATAATTTTTYASSYDAAVSSLHGDHSGSSELTPLGWIFTIFTGLLGGIFLRWYEQASLEIVTAVMGGVGCAYSIHTFVITQGGQLHRSIVFLIANFMSYFGWRFQRGRRLYRNQYSHKKNEERSQTQTQQPSSASASYAYSPILSTTSSTTTTTAPTWDQLQTSIDSMEGLLQRTQPQASSTSEPAPSVEQIVELTQSLQTLLQRINTTPNSKEGNGNSGTETAGKRN